MNKIDRLLRRYEGFVALPWERSLAGVQRVWIIIYDPTDERRMRARQPEFELATRRGGHGWLHKDLTDSFTRWLAAQPYRESYFEDPANMAMAMPLFHKSLAAQVREVLAREDLDEDTVVALSGVGCLFGFARVSALIEEAAAHIPGRLLIFFPGSHEDNNYRLLDARDGWNYMAVPITATDEAEA